MGRKASCFSIPKITWLKKLLPKKNSSHEEAAKAKVQTARVWPGDGYSPRAEAVYLKSFVESTQARASSESFVESSQSSSSSLSAEAAAAAAAAAEDERKSPSLEAEEEGNLTDDASSTAADDGDTQRQVSVSGHLKRVEDWVNSLDEPVSENPHWNAAEDEEQDTMSPSGSNTEAEDTMPASGSREFNTEAEASPELNTIIVKSLMSRTASSANLSKIGVTIPPLLGAFSNLRTVSLSGNSIVKLPAGCLPTNLRELDLSKNKISVIEGLRSLTRLRVLSLSHNRISRIGQGLANCCSIRELYLSGNNISAVDGLHRLRKLFLLDLSKNRLATTKSLMQLAANYSTLQVLNLQENPVLRNHSEEQLRRFATVVAPRLSYLNMLPIKALPAHDTALSKFALSSARARKATRTATSKAKRVESLQARHSSRRRSRR